LIDEEKRGCGNGEIIGVVVGCVYVCTCECCCVCEKSEYHMHHANVVWYVCLSNIQTH